MDLKFTVVWLRWCGYGGVVTVPKGWTCIVLKKDDMSFASRLKAKLGGEPVVPIPVATVMAPVAPVVVPVAKNENNFIPTKYGEELAHAVKSYLPRGATTAAAVAPQGSVPDIKSEELFPSLSAGAVAAPAPKTKSGMNGSVSWAEKARAEKPVVEEDEWA